MRRSLLAVGLVFLCSTALSQSRVTAIRGIASGTDVAVRVDLDHATSLAQARLKIRADNDPVDTWLDWPATVSDKTVTATVPLTKFPDATDVSFYVAATDASGSAAFTTPTMTVDVKAPRAVSDLQHAQQTVKGELSETAKRLADVEKQLTTANVTLAQQAATLPNEVKFVEQLQAKTTPNSTVLKFETWRNSNKQQGRVQITQSGGSNFEVARQKGDFTTDHHVQVQTVENTSGAPKSYSFSAVVLNHLGKPEESTRITGSFTLPPRSSNLQLTAVPVPEKATSTAITLTVTPPNDSLIRIERLDEDNKVVGTYGDTLDRDEWGFPISPSLHTQGKAHEIVVPELAPDRAYRFNVITLDKSGNAATLPTIGNVRTRPVFDFAGPIAVELSQLGYNITFGATDEATEGAFQLKFANGETSKWITGKPDGKNGFTATMSADQLAKWLAVGEGFPVLRISVTPKYGKDPVMRDVQMRFAAVEDKQKIKEANPKLNEQQIKAAYDAVRGKKKINWGELATKGITALLVGLL